jgi:hypothetical protein
MVIGLTGDRAGSVNFSEQLAGFGATDLHRSATALMAMAKTRELDIYDLEAGKCFFKVRPGVIMPTWVADLILVSEAMLRVNVFYGVDLIWPASITESDLHALNTLDQLIDGLPLRITNIRTRMTKMFELTPAQARDSIKSGTFRFEHQIEAVSLFGVSVMPGPVGLTVSGGRIEARAAFASFLHRAPIGTTINLDVSCPLGATVAAIPR